MSRLQNVTLFLLVLNLLAGCAAFLVPETSDPAKKLEWARELIDNQGRPLPAERLIRDAIEIYRSQHDDSGLAEAYRVYGLFFKSAAVVREQRFYREKGFIDKSATYDNRLEKAAEYFGESLIILQKIGDLHALPNLYLQIAFTQQLMKNTNAACASFDDSLKAHQIRMRQHPETMVVLPKEFSSFEDGIAVFKQQAGCNG